MQQPLCPICGKKIASLASDVAPFCSRRCRQIDMKRWLNEEYGVPVVDRDDDDLDSPSPPDEREP